MPQSNVVRAADLNRQRYIFTINIATGKKVTHTIDRIISGNEEKKSEIAKM